MNLEVSVYIIINYNFFLRLKNCAKIRIFSDSHRKNIARALFLTIFQETAARHTTQPVLPQPVQDRTVTFFATKSAVAYPQLLNTMSYNLISIKQHPVGRL